LPGTVILRHHAVAHGTAVLILPRQEGHLDEALLPDSHQPGVDGGGGQVGVIGINVGAPDGAGRSASHREEEDPVLLAADGLKPGATTRPRDGLRRRRPDGPPPALYRLDAKAAGPRAIIAADDAIAAAATVALLASHNGHLDHSLFGRQQRTGVDCRGRPQRVVRVDVGAVDPALHTPPDPAS